MEIIQMDCLTDNYKEDLWNLVVEADREFVPPLSARNSTVQKQLGENHSSGSLPEYYFAELLKQKFLLAVEGEKLRGFLSYITEYQNEYLCDVKPICYVSTIIVDREYRSRGISGSLYGALERENRQCALATRTWSTNGAHIHLLKKLGFAEVKRLPDDRGEGIDTVYFQKM